MLSATEIHYISGYLYVASGENPVSVTLGEKLYDKKAREPRDVDIALIRAANFGVLAVEVKHHRRKLDTTTVEQLCAKLCDMPNATTRAIVSSSGFTAPALRKAAANHVACLKLVRGPVPPLSTIDISKLKKIDIVEHRWIEPPRVVIGPAVILADAEKGQINPRKRVRLGNGEVITLRKLSDRLVSQADLTAVNFDSGDEQAVEVFAEFDHPVEIAFTDRTVSFPDASVRGNVRRVVRSVPLHTACYLAYQNDAPFAAAILFEVNRVLFGLAVAPGGRTMRIFQIPPAVRKRRPTKHRIFETTA